MKIKALLFILILGGMLNAQIRVQYELTYKIDSTSDNTEKEWFSLDIKDDSSIFYPTSYVVMDSLVEKGVYNKTKDFREPSIFYMVNKNKDELSSLEFVSISLFSVKEPRKIEWELLPNSTSQLEGMVTHKAKANFAGRTWIAEYTNEIPVSEGPYKFRGLPGLILNIKDSTDSYEFKFMNIRNIKRIFNPKTFEVLGLKIVPISVDKYQKILSEVESNPKIISYMLTGSYESQLPQELINDLIERYKKEKVSKNNPIELSFE